jgi:hypothetical protein
MRIPLGPWHFLTLAALLTGVAVLATRWDRTSGASLTPAQLSAHLPPSAQVRIFIDVRALRNARILALLAASPAEQDADYRRFVQQTGFDYQRDLQTLLAASDGAKRYFLLSGRFDWARLTAYATANGGVCQNRYCRLPGSEPAKRISFFPLRTSVLALAIGPDPSAASVLAAPNGAAPALPAEENDPIRITAPGSGLAHSGDWPFSGAAPYLRVLQPAERVTLSAGFLESGDSEVRLRADCATPETAGEMYVQLQRLTQGLRAAIGPDSGAPELGKFLGGGQFAVQGNAVAGKWPISRTLFTAAAGGGL